MENQKINYVRNPVEYREILKQVKKIQEGLQNLQRGVDSDGNKIMVVSQEQIIGLIDECNKIIKEIEIASRTAKTEKTTEKYRYIEEDLQEKIKVLKDKYSRLLEGYNKEL